jgi:hypothetical protein
MLIKGFGNWAFLFYSTSMSAKNSTNSSTNIEHEPIKLFKHYIASSEIWHFVLKVQRRTKTWDRFTRHRVQQGHEFSYTSYFVTSQLTDLGCDNVLPVQEYYRPKRTKIGEY